MNKFKDSMNRWLTTGLFKETSQMPQFVVWTLEEAKQLYLATDDPTGYTFATEHLGGWSHWLALHASPNLRGILKSWEEELEVKLRAAALQEVLKHSKSDKGYQAAKYLVEAGWKPKEIGRPSREKIEKEARIKSRMYAEFKDLRLNS